MSLQNEIVKLMVALEEIQGLTKVEIFQSGPQWWTDHQTVRPLVRQGHPKSYTTSMAKNVLLSNEMLLWKKKM